MRWIFLLALAGCRPDYWIPAQAPIGDAAKADSVIAAVREDSEKTVAVKAANLVPCDAPIGLPAGARRVHGNLRKSAKWGTGVGLLVGGIIGTAGGVPLAIAGSLGGYCNDSCYNYRPPWWTLPAGIIGGIVATVSELSFLIVGPTLIARGARDSAGEAPVMPGVQLKF